MDTPFRDRNNRPIEITDLYRGRECFLVCGGPSIRDPKNGVDLNLLNQRGILIASFNNCPAVLPPNVRPNLWLFNDKPIKFCDALFQDPAILKFMPVTMWNRQKKNWKVYARNDQGQLVPSQWFPIDMPCVIAYGRQYDFNPETFLTYSAFDANAKRNFGAICQGNDMEHALAKKMVKNPKTGVKEPQPIPGQKPNGWPHVINTMFSALCLPWYLGIRTVYLVGCDFRMSVEKPYAFDQTKWRGGVIDCNQHFKLMTRCFRGLKPVFDAAGYRVFNTYQYSGLADEQGLVFPYKPFTECVDECRQYSKFPAVLDTANRYDAGETVPA